MGITGSIGTFHDPFRSKETDNTPRSVEYLQTSGSAASTTVNIIGKESSADLCKLLWLSVDIIDPTSNSEHVVTVATATILGQMPTGTAYSRSWNFGPLGLVCGNTDTYSVYVRSGVAGTATVRFAAGILRAV